VTRSPPNKQTTRAPLACFARTHTHTLMSNDPERLSRWRQPPNSRRSSRSTSFATTAPSTPPGKLTASEGLKYLASAAELREPSLATLLRVSEASDLDLKPWASSWHHDPHSSASMFSLTRPASPLDSITPSPQSNFGLFVLFLFSRWLVPVSLSISISLFKLDSKFSPRLGWQRRGNRARL